MSGRVIHFEIPVEDSEMTVEFFHQVFGWESKPLNESAGTLVTGLDTEPGVDGYFFKKSTVPADYARIIIAVEVDDLEAHIEKVKANDGEILFGPIDYAGRGRMAYFKDTEGNIVGMLERKKDGGNS
ncbi:MAG: VOC family protein [Candidatus Thorarchaeota archaeon]|jgi:predicted enzyme related to lactoylglutathione lyase